MGSTEPAKAVIKTLIDRAAKEMGKEQWLGWDEVGLAAEPRRITRSHGDGQRPRTSATQ